MIVGAASGAGEADGTELAGAVAQHVFRAIGAAADDVQTVFGEDAADVAALFLVWALAETERCVAAPLPHLQGHSHTSIVCRYRC